MSTSLTHAVALEDLRTVLFAHKLRRRTAMPIAGLAVMTAPTLFEVDCSSGARHMDATRRAAMRLGAMKARVQPLQRGNVAHLFERVQARAGRREVQRTWQAGIGQLRREPRYTLHLPLAAGVQP